MANRAVPAVHHSSGLIETHAHLGARPRSHPDVPAPEWHEQGWNALHSVFWARQLASVGVTSVQSLGSAFYTDVVLREAINRGLVEGPRIVAAGPMITTTAGHDWRTGSEVDSIDDIRHAVREHHKAGVDVIKVGATGGFFTPGSAQRKAQFTVEELSALVEDAHRLGHRVAVHAHGTEGIQRAVEARVDYIAHGTFISDNGTTKFIPELADEIARKGIYVDVAAPPSYPLSPARRSLPAPMICTSMVSSSSPAMTSVRSSLRKHICSAYINLSRQEYRERRSLSPPRHVLQRQSDSRE